MMTLYFKSDDETIDMECLQWIEYRLDGNSITKVKCRQDRSGGSEIRFPANTEEIVTSWKLDDADVPEWIYQYVD